MTLSWKSAVPQVMPNTGPQPRTERTTKGVPYQILHARYLLECWLQKFVKVSANFDIVFFQGSCHQPEVGRVIDAL